MARSYKFASDVHRDSMAAELWDGAKMLAVVTRLDTEKRLVIETFGEIDLVEIEALIAVARERLTDFEDGSPLPRRSEV